MTAIGRGVRDRPIGICHPVESFSLDLILRSRLDVVSTWDETEVAGRWLLICPMRKNSAEDPVSARADHEAIRVFLPENQALTSMALRELARTQITERPVASTMGVKPK